MSDKALIRYCVPGGGSECMVIDQDGQNAGRILAGITTRRR